MMKVILSGILVAISTWTGTLLTILAIVEEVAKKQFWLGMGAAVLFCVAILCAGYGHSQKENKYDKAANK